MTSRQKHFPSRLKMITSFKKSDPWKKSFYYHLLEMKIGIYEICKIFYNNISRQCPGSVLGKTKLRYVDHDLIFLNSYYKSSEVRPYRGAIIIKFIHLKAEEEARESFTKKERGNFESAIIISDQIVMTIHNADQYHQQIAPSYRSTISMKEDPRNRFNFYIFVTLLSFGIKWPITTFCHHVFSHVQIVKKT